MAFTGKKFMLAVIDQGVCAMTYRLFVLCLVLTLSFSKNASATHAAGADLTYQCLGGLVYQIEATFYRDCGGSSEPGNVTISYKSASCNYARTILANKVALNNGQEITLPCTTSPSTCNGGVTTGIRKWVYRTVVTLPSACADWVFSYRICCRNCTVTTIQNPCAVNSEIYVESTLNNLIAPGNSSPVFNNMPVAFVCLGQNFNYNQGVFDVDGDSLSYELIPPKISATGEVSWLAPASTQTPLASSTPFTLNPITGDINFTPSSIQVGILAIRVNEYRNGQLIGSTIRDMQVYTQNCFNSIPVASGINGTANYMTNVCAGEDLCFTVSSQDVDAAQSVSFSVYNPIQGSTTTQTSGNHPSLEFCWTPEVNDIRGQPYIFTLTIIDNACPVNGIQTFSYSIFVNGPVATISVVDPQCGTNTGSASANVSNATNCSYSWNTSPPQLAQTVTGLVPGNYSVTITDQNGCSSIHNAVLNSPPNSIQLSCTSSGVISCQTGSIGTASTSVTGGVSPLTYVWNTGASSTSINGLSAGTYYVTVTDANGCSAIDSTVIESAPGNLTTNVTAIDHIACYGVNNGSVSVTGIGGLAPYTYLWSNGNSTANINGLPAGNYSVVVTDANGCTATSIVSINQPHAPVNVNFVSNTISCHGGSNGSLNSFVNGGTFPYSYNWSNGASTQNISGLTAGSYNVIVTDANGCSGNFSASVTQPASALSAAVAASQQVTCFGGDDGEIELAVSGGQSPYTYSWSHGATSAAIQNLEAGNYSVTVSDANGCTTVVIETVSQPVSQPNVTLSAQQIACFNGNNGAVSATASNGAGSYSYLWNTGSTTSQLNGLIPGMYTVTVTDGNACTSTASIEITQPNTPIIPVLSVSAPLNCESDRGTISVTVNGGTAPFSFLWSHGAATQNAIGLVAGEYTVTVTDANGCTAMVSESISASGNFLTASIAVTQAVSCFGGSNGTLTAIPTGGTAPFSFMWHTGVQSSIISNLRAGNYSVTITDNNGCTSIISTALPQPPSGLTLSGNVTGANCLNGETGSIMLNIGGGTPGYSFIWSNGTTSQNISNLNTGNYSVSVTDANGCTVSATYEISGTTDFTLTTTGSPVICTGEMVTLVADSVIDGIYQWFYDGNPLNGANGMQFITPAAGMYSVSLTNNCGTFTSNEIEVEVKSIGNVGVSNTQIICPPETAQLLATGGITYEWTPATYITFTTIPDPFVSPLNTTTYKVNITNEWGCKTSLSTEVAVVCDTLLVPTGFSPNNDGVNDGYVIDGIENYPGNKLWVYNRWGKLVYKATDYNNSWDGIGNISGNSMGQKVLSGTYYFILDLNDGSKPKAGYLIIRG